MSQYQIPGRAFQQEGPAGQYQIPGRAFVSVTAVAAPFVIAAFFSPQHHPGNEWIPQAQQQNAIIAAAPLPNPLNVSPLLQAPEPNRIFFDSTRGTPTVLLSAPAQAPLIGPPFLGPQQHPQNEWLPADTSTGISLAIRSIRPASNLTFTAPEPNRTFFDSSRGTPNTLTVPPAVPVSSSLSFNAPAPRLIVSDTTRGSPQALLTPPAAPFTTSLTASAPAPQFSLTDTTHGSPDTIIGSIKPVGLSFNYTQPDNIRPVTDTSRSVPSTLTAPVVIPVGQQVFVGPALFWQILADSTKGSDVALYTFVQPPPPPGQTVQLVPAWYPSLPADTTTPYAWAIVIPPPPPVPPQPPGFSVPGWMGGGSPSSKHIAKYIDDLPLFREVEREMAKGATLNQAMQPRKGAAPHATFRAARIPKIEPVILPPPLPYDNVREIEDFEAEDEEAVVQFLLNNYADL